MKVLLISHIADPDGVTNAVLGKLVFKDIDIKLTELNDVDKLLKEGIESNQYDNIYITDLNMTEEMAKYIDKEEELKKKVHVFDHHISQISLNKYSFIDVIVEKNNRKECGTSLFYNYLLSISDNEILRKNSTKKIVNLVRSIDTFDFQEISKDEAFTIQKLFSIFGRDKYIDYLINYVTNNDEFILDGSLKLIIDTENDRVKRYVEQKEQEMYKVKIDGYNAGLVYAEDYRTELGDYLNTKYKDILDFIIIINVSRSISLRGQGKVDLSVLSTKYGGGGHKNAAGIKLPKDFLKNITNLIFKDIEFYEK